MGFSLLNHPLTKHTVRLRRGAPVVFHTVLFLFTLEIAVAFVAPALVPDRLYLRSYLSDKAEEQMRNIIEDRTPYLEWDDVLGWKNRPNSGQDKWQIDAHGARTTRPVPVERDGLRRILFLGNSLTNGGMHVENTETISALLEDSTTETLNFATMLYSVDQMLLSYQHELRKFKPDVLVVGIRDDPFPALRSRYIPFLSRAEVNMPFVKPRLVSASDSLVLIPPPPRAEFSRLLDGSAFLGELRETDGYYGEFARYERFGLTPISNTIWKTSKRIRNLVRLLRPIDDDDARLLIQIMSALTVEAEGDGVDVVFMLLPKQEITFPPLWRRGLADHYGQLLSMLQDNGYPVLDARAALRDSGYSAPEAYYRDGVHFTPAGNRVVAEALRRLIASRE